MAEHWGTRAQKLELLEEALASAQQQEEINRIISVSAWPLRVMVRIAPDTVLPHLYRLVDLGKAEGHTLRRADGLYAVGFAVKGNPALLAVVVTSLVEALVNGCGWRIDRLIRSTVEMVDGPMSEVVDQLVAHHSEGPIHRAGGVFSVRLSRRGMSFGRRSGRSETLTMESRYDAIVL